jgi:predicted HD superfamily hydrolase involved in NAD metabolism
MIKLQHKMKKKLDKYRYEHTLGVMYTAGALAMRHDINLDDALMAGLLHDCAKCYSDEKKFALCEKYKVTLTTVEQKNPALIHAKLGAVLAKEKYGADDMVCDAIRSHTTGEPGMNRLQQIVFIADYIEPHRDHSPNLYEIRQMAFQDLDEACYMILSDSLNYLSDSDRSIDPMTQKTYEYYVENKKR